MIDINLIRNNPEIIQKDLEKRKDTDKLKWLDKIKNLDEEWKKLKLETEKLRNLRNVVSREIGKLKKEGKDAKEKLNEASLIPKQIEEIEEKQKNIRKEIDNLLLRLPNILHESVPYGIGEEGNIEVDNYGDKPVDDFPRISHVDLLENLGLADISRAAKISGSRFWFLKGAMAELDLALQKYATDFMIKRGFTLIQPPFMMNRQAYEGVTDLSDFEDVMYKIDGEDLYLIATSEHPMVAQYYDEILEEQDLPIKLVGLSSCFRKEAGAHGKDQKGIFRGHQFNKIEQIVICKPEDSWKYHEEITQHAVEFWNSLGLNFRKVNICTGDIGTVAAKKYDLEAWYPVQNSYREVVSASNCTDYQARRLKIRFRTKEGNKYVHTLNSTCVATSRALVAIMENNQQKDGSILIPYPLQKYMERTHIK